MTAKEQGLPELPMAVAVVTPSKYLAWLSAWLSSKNWEPTPDGTHLYTADQMRDYALAALASDTGERGVCAEECQRAIRAGTSAAVCPMGECALRAQPAGGGERRPNHRWLPTDVLGNPLREYAPGKWESATWPSDAPPESGGQGEAVRKVIAEMNEFLEQDAEVWLDTLARWRDELATSLAQGGGNGR